MNDVDYIMDVPSKTRRAPSSGNCSPLGTFYRELATRLVANHSYESLRLGPGAGADRKPQKLGGFPNTERAGVCLLRHLSLLANAFLSAVFARLTRSVGNQWATSR